MRVLITLTGVFVAFLLKAQPTWTPATMIKYQRLMGAEISPDGKYVAYTVSVPRMENEESSFLTHIWVAATDGSLNRQFTFGNESCTNPQFSPDGKRLAFISSRNGGKSQLYILPLNGGEAEQVTKVDGNVGNYKWSPDGKRLAFIMTDPLTKEEEKRRKEKWDMVVAGEFKFGHLYTVDLQQKNEKGMAKVKRLTRGAFHVLNFDWSPDGKTIAFAYQVDPTLDALHTLDISSVPADSGTVKVLVGNPGMDTNPCYSPDGKWIAYVSEGDKVSWAGGEEVYVMPASGGQPRKLASTHDLQPNIVRWSSDSKHIYATEAYKTARSVYALPADGKSPKMLTPLDGVYSSPSVTRMDDLMALIFQNASTPPQVVVMNMKDKKIRKLTALNEDFAKRTHAKTEVVSWRSKDDKFEIEGLVTYPLNYEKGKKYPLILNIHGGPAGVFTQTYTGASSPYPLQAFAEQGYVILRPNPRGSSGYGDDFRRANINDWGFGDYDDLMAGVDKLIADGLVHPDSLCVTGWSYGGYMTSMIITKTDRFKAAMVGAGVTNLISFTGTADVPGFIPDYFSGEMWDRTEVYMKHSAMFAVKNVKTPTLIIHGERDLRVPVSQGQELYMALKRLGVKTQMVTYPRTPHGPQEPKFIQDIGERVIEWFNENCRNNKMRTASVN